jgi:hypothetical protein
MNLLYSANDISKLNKGTHYIEEIAFVKPSTPSDTGQVLVALRAGFRQTAFPSGGMPCRGTNIVSSSLLHA